MLLYNLEPVVLRRAAAEGIALSAVDGAWLAATRKLMDRWEDSVTYCDAAYSTYWDFEWVEPRETFFNGHAIPKMSIDQWVELLRTAQIGTVLVCRSAAAGKPEKYYKKTDNKMWHREHRLRAPEEIKAPMFLPDIRAETARQLGVELSSTFHKVFDAAANAAVEDW